MRQRTVTLLLLCLSTLVGCQQRTASKLIGKWEGTPDTSEARQLREAEKYGDALDEEPTETDPDSVTDWEAYDIRVALNFSSRSEVSLSLDNGPNPVAGTWNMVQAGPTACTIEIETPTSDDDAPELRRFKLELDERDGELLGFLLSEVGADRGLGALYFRRADN